MLSRTLVGQRSCCTQGLRFAFTFSLAFARDSCGAVKEVLTCQKDDAFIGFTIASAVEGRRAVRAKSKQGGGCSVN